ADVLHRNRFRPPAPSAGRFGQRGMRQCRMFPAWLSNPGSTSNERTSDALTLWFAVADDTRAIAQLRRLPPD
ncbi:hypothetical protein, partial [Nocardia tengchongensis]|uniref:hypothetical protein n=1 Tax=Nocardia tengchongensis TaxID=2055889 RepID=UPI0036C5A0B6